MARYKPVFRGLTMIPLSLEDQIVEGMFEFALRQLVDEGLDLSGLDARFNNDETGASAYDPQVMLKVVLLLGYSRGLISSRSIARACAENVMFMSMSGDGQPSYTHIAKFVRELELLSGRQFSYITTRSPRCFSNGVKSASLCKRV
jgi:transposase